MSPISNMMKITGVFDKPILLTNMQIVRGSISGGTYGRSATGNFATRESAGF